MLKPAKTRFTLQQAIVVFLTLKEALFPLKLTIIKKSCLKDFNDYRFNIILKARQLGISTITAAYIAWLMLFHRDKNILSCSNESFKQLPILLKSKAIIKHLPALDENIRNYIDNRTSFELSNGSQIKGSSTSSDAGRSEALSLLVVDEAAHVEKLGELWTALYPTCQLVVDVSPFNS